MDTATVTIRVDGSEESVELPSDVFSFLAEESQSPASTAADLLVLDCTHRLHAQAHHADGEPDESLLELESEMREQFEARFGASFAELTGHQH